MKLFLMSLLLIANAQAGVILNEKTNDEIRLQLNSSENTLEIKYLKDDILKETSIGLAQFEEQKEIVKHDSINADVLDSPAFSSPYSTTILVANDAREEKSYQLYFALPLFAALDTVFLPLTLPSYLIKNAHTKKDIRILMGAVNDNETAAVSKKRFERIKKYLSL